MFPPHEIFTVRQVAVFLSCSKAHVCKAIRGEVHGVTPLPAISMGRRKLIRRSSLEAWLLQNDAGVIVDASHNSTP